LKYSSSSSRDARARKAEVSQVRDRQHREVDRPVQVDRDLLPQALPRLQLLEVEPPHDARVVDQHVHVRELLHHLVPQRDAGGLASGVGDEGVQARHLGLRDLQRLGAATADDNLVALAVKALRERQADARGSARHEHRVLGQLHGLSSCALPFLGGSWPGAILARDRPLPGQSWVRSAHSAPCWPVT
jgi:hypothetical protein